MSSLPLPAFRPALLDPDTSGAGFVGVSHKKLKIVRINLNFHIHRLKITKNLKIFVKDLGTKRRPNSKHMLHEIYG